MNYKTPPNVTYTPGPAPSAGLLGSLKGVGGSILSAGLNIGSSFLTNYFNQRAANEQRAWLEEMWNKQSQYNSPVNQAALLKAAGLNPYAMTGMQPAGSVGNSPPANVVPITAGDPLSALKTIAEVDNIRAVTGKTETEEEKILKEISLIDIGVARGLLTNKEAEFMLNKLFEAYKDRNPFTIQANNTESGTEANKAAAAASNAQADLLTAQAATEWLSQNYKVGLLSSQKEYYEALKQTEDDLRSGKVNAQTLRNSLDSLDFALRQKYGDDYMKYDLEKLQDTVMENDEFREFRKSILQAQDIEAWANANLAELTHTDLVNLPPRERYLINLFSNLASNLK